MLLPGKKIYRVTARIDIAPDKLIYHMKDSEKLCQWNTTITEHKILKVLRRACLYNWRNLRLVSRSFQRLNDKVAISYQVTAKGGPGGVVSPRDFVFLFKTEYHGDTFVQGGCSVDFPGPKSSKIVRYEMCRKYCIHI